MGRTPVTPAIRALRAEGVEAEPVAYRYEAGGAEEAAVALGLGPSTVVKTLVVEADGEPRLVLMHGDREVSLRSVGRVVEAKRVTAADPATAERVTGYRVGGISPFGTRRRLPVVVQTTVLELAEVHVNAGRRGLLVAVDPQVFVDLLDATVADIAVRGTEVPEY